MSRIIARKMIDDPHGFQYPGIAHQFLEFGAFVWTVQAGGNQYRDLIGVHARIEQLTNDLGQKEAIWHRARNVANEDAGVLLALCQLGERPHADRPAQRFLHRIRWIQKRGGLADRERTDCTIVREGDIQAGTTVIERYVH